MTEFLSYSFLASIITCYLTFFWSTIGVFKLNDIHNSILYNFLKIFSLAFWIYSIYLYFQAPLSLWQQLIGLAGNILSLAIFFWARYHIQNKNFSVIFGKDLPNNLVLSGPYRFVRHPFYTAYLMCYLSTSVALSSIVLGLIFLALFGMYIAATMLEEMKFTQSDLITEYYIYKKKTGRFFPKLSNK